MDEMKNENTKLANQAWRKKPRKFASKSKLGCKTCKIRRVKCDQSRPACLKCQSTGRTCDGYSELPLALGTRIESSHSHNKADKAESRGDSYHSSCTTVGAYQPNQWHEQYHDLSPQNLGPFMILPMTGSVQAGAMCFFEYISIKHLNEYQPCESWRKSLMFFSQTVPSVRHAAIALALIHRKYQDGYLSDYMLQPQSSKDWAQDKTPLFHYNRAIQLLLDQKVGNDSSETTAITLLVCYLFTCFDHLTGNDVQAMKHLRGGVELSSNIRQAILSNNNNIYDDANPSGIHALIYQVTRQIRRLDMQAVMFLLDWTPAIVQETFISQLPLSDGAFRSLDQAADCLQILVVRVMGLRNSEQQMYPVDMMNPPPPPSLLKDIVLDQLETWSSLFEDMLQQGSFGYHQTDPETNRVISLLRLKHYIVWIFLSSYGSGREMDYDKFLPQFRRCVALASDATAAHERYSGSVKPTFTPEVGILPALYIIGAKCRHPVVRREALSILRRQPMREAVWNSTHTAIILERVIEIEEGGSERGEVTQSMEQIAVWQRIEALSWVLVTSDQSVARLDMMYTLCTREGMHTESLML